MQQEIEKKAAESAAPVPAPKATKAVK